MEVSPGSPKSNEHNGHADDGSSEKEPSPAFHGPIPEVQLMWQSFETINFLLQIKAYNLTRDHKPNLAAEKDRILKASGFVQYGLVNWTLNLSRSIGDMELKRNKSLLADEQIVTANPDLNTCMSSQQLVDFVRDQLNTETKLSVVCRRVFDRCIECKGSQIVIF
ncbi:probable protein phosphatase 2C 60 isoform X2 [Rhododendron vialii]|uniref:probable protein phosphatase 2C 60 isoform X2 n=1 Tax=Rhododendron vialii TaxID=182163 RepID=UPI00265E9D51|nr:probable protein phosphatase 2C 60 isoform X2 [Rhododendron vialii]XP_058188021.1 probable protein phosphatase 2C 60 isoform X2 [Rhododendron vialii]